VFLLLTADPAKDCADRVELMRLQTEAEMSDPAMVESMRKALDQQAMTKECETRMADDVAACTGPGKRKKDPPVIDQACLSDPNSTRMRRSSMVNPIKRQMRHPGHKTRPLRLDDLNRPV
jgi:hypothetical protein